jgi:hypothetical protein
VDGVLTTGATAVSRSICKVERARGRSGWKPGQEPQPRQERRAARAAVRVHLDRKDGNALDGWVADGDWLWCYGAGVGDSAVEARTARGGLGNDVHSDLLAGAVSGVATL